MEDELEGLEVRIFVLDRGFVGVGYAPDPTGAGFWIKVRNWRIIRNWGTTEGLAELLKGPITNKTKLDTIAPVYDCPVRAIIGVYLAEKERWEHHLRLTSPTLASGKSRRTSTQT